MVHERVYNIFPVLPIKYLIDKDIDPTTPYKVETGMKNEISHLCLLFCLCAMQKSTAHLGKKALNICHQEQRGFLGIYCWDSTA